MESETKTIQVLTCLYRSPCRVRLRIYELEGGKMAGLERKVKAMRRQEVLREMREELRK